MANDIKVGITLEGDDALRTLSALKKGLKDVGTEGENTAKKTKSGLDKMSASAAVFIGNLGAIAATRAFDILRDEVANTTRAFLDFETAVTGVGKTTGLTGKELENFSKDVLKLTKVLPIASDELLEIAEAAGQLGVKGKKNLLLFSETIAKLGRVSNLSGAEAATTLTRILNVTGEGIDTIDDFASGIVALGNNFAATEAEIARMTNEVSRATAQFGVSAGEAASLSVVMRSFGVRAEEAGTVTGKSFRAIQAAIEGGGKALEQLEKITGKTGAELKVQFGQDATGVFRTFLGGLERLGKGGAVVSDELAKMGLVGERVLKVLPVFSTNVDELDRALETFGTGAKDASALIEEFGIAASTNQAKVDILNNSIDRARIRIGENLVKALAKATPLLTAFFDQIGEDRESTFIRTTDDVKKLSTELGILQRKKEAVEKDGKVSFFEADPEVLATQISAIQEKLAQINTGNAVTAIKALETELQTLQNLDSEAVSSGAFGTFGEVEARKEQLVEQIRNGNQQLLLEQNGLVAQEAALRKAAADKEAEDAALATENKLEAQQSEFDAIRELKAAEKEILLEEKEEENLAKELEGEENFQALVDSLGREATLREINRISQIEGEEKRRAALIKLNDKADAVVLKKAKLQAKAEIRLAQQTTQAKLNIVGSSLALAEALTGKSNKAIFFAQKALSIAQIIVAGSVAQAAALAPPPLGAGPVAGIGLAGLIQANTVIQVATVAATSAGSFQSGGIIDGASQTGDQLTANVNGGEAIFNRRQQQNLFNAVDNGSIGGGGGTSNTFNIQSPSGDIPQETIDNIIDNINDRTEFGNRTLGVA